MKMADDQEALIERDVEKVNVNKIHQKPRKPLKKIETTKKWGASKKKCRNCGGEYHHTGRCPAFEKHATSARKRIISSLYAGK